LPRGAPALVLGMENRLSQPKRQLLVVEQK